MSSSDQESDQSIWVLGDKAASRSTRAASSFAASGGRRRNESSSVASCALSGIDDILHHQYTSFAGAQADPPMLHSPPPSAILWSEPHARTLPARRLPLSGRAFPEASIDFRVTREQASTLAESFLTQAKTFLNRQLNPRPRRTRVV
jgi:hypothetical protein